jgi:16S rRNA (uracil1498-N3)-methyltransferase
MIVGQNPLVVLTNLCSRELAPDKPSKEKPIDITVTNFIVEPDNVTGERLTLNGEEAKHLSQVLRAKVGDTFWAFDGSGLKYRAVIESINKASITALIASTSRLENEPFFNVTLAQGICRPNKMDDIVEKGTEIGVSGFIFYFSDKAYSRQTEESSASRKTSRLVRIARSAAKQSKRSIIPNIADFVTFAQLLSLRKDFDLAPVAHQDPASKPVEHYLENTDAVRKILLLVGPESGLSESEFEACLNAGFMPTHLGPRRLRTETAAIIFPALILNRLGDL